MTAIKLSVGIIIFTMLFTTSFQLIFRRYTDQISIKTNFKFSIFLACVYLIIHIIETNQ